MYVNERRLRSAYHSPVNLKVGEKHVVECRVHCQNVGIFVQLPQVLAMLIQRSGLVPSSSNTWVILPLVEQAKMLRVGVVEGNHREMLL